MTDPSIKLPFDVYICPHDVQQGRKLDEILTLLKQGFSQILAKETNLMATLDETLQAVQSETTVDQALVVLVQSIKAQLDAATSGQLTAAQQAQVDAIFTGIQGNIAAVTAAVTANTPVAPPPAP